jgi:hypothetical protein
MDEWARTTHWIDGTIVDDAPRPAGSAWLWLAAVVLLVFAVDFTLGLGSEASPPREQAEAAEIREQLRAASEAADGGRPAFVLVGDSVLAGDVMATRVADWESQRVLDHMRAELGVDSNAELRQVAFDGLLPIDALHVLAELDRLDPDGEVRFVFELNLRYFSSHYVEQRDCSRPSLCELGRTPEQAKATAVEHAARGLVATGKLAHDWLERRAPIHRHRPQLDQVDLGELDGLAVARSVEAATPAEATQTEGLARVQAHYRDDLTAPDHAQLDALAQIIERLRARGRPAALFFTPLEDEFVAMTLTPNGLGRRYEQLARYVHERGLEPPGSRHRPPIELLDLDHPLFGSEYFLDHVHLDPEGNRMLALNLLHELGLPLRDRPFEWMMVHDEDHDRSLVHRRGVGFADGGALRALFRTPEGVAVSRTGDWIVIADTGNHMLRQLRGSMQIVERLAGAPRRSGHVDGPASHSLLELPRSPEIVGDDVYFLDGRDRSRVRALVGGKVETLTWMGPSCDAYDELESRIVDHRAWLYLLCTDDRVLILDPLARSAALAFDPRHTGMLVGVRGLEPTDDGRLLLADGQSRIWSVPLEGRNRRPQLLFANQATELLPQEFKTTYPFSFAEMRLAQIVGMEWVERYDALLVQDEHPLGRGNARLQREQTERIHLRLLDLDARLIYPWIKPIPHAEAFHMWNAVSQNLVSYYHLGAMAVVQDDASLVYLERARSRVFRIADGMLGVAKSGNLHTTWSKIELFQPVNTETATEVSETMRPDRWLGNRHEPIPHQGPYVALLVGSSMSTISDRFGNYSLARLLELELQAELGYRDGIRLDLFQRIHSSASFKAGGNVLDDFLAGGGPPPDIVFIELHDFQRKYFRHTKTRTERLAQLGRIERLAARYDTLVIFYDNSAMVSEKSDGLRETSKGVRELIDDARKLGFVVLEPSDRLLRELLVESPWGSQTWGRGLHHGSPWAIELTARAYASIAYPVIREFLRGRTPARELERDPASFAEQAGDAGLAVAFANTEGLIDRAALPEVRGSFISREYEDRHLQLFVDLAGAGDYKHNDASFEALALSVLYAELETEVYGQLAERVDIELLKFENYDEYGEGVREAAAVAWKTSLDGEQLEALIRRVAERQAGSP